LKQKTDLKSNIKVSPITLTKERNFNCLYLGIITLLALFSSNSTFAQIIMWDDSANCGPNAQVLWVNPTCPGDDDGIVSIRVDTAAFTFPFEITILAGVQALPNYNGVTINATGVDTFFNVPASATSIIGEDQLTNPLPCPFLFNFVDDPDEIDPQVAFSNQVQCFGLTVDSIVATNTNGVPPFQYSWKPGVSTGFVPSFGSSNSVIVDVPADTFGVVIEDADGCRDSVFVPVVEPDTLVALANANDILCRGDNNGSIRLNVSGGTRFTVGNTYNYTWSPALSNDSVQTGLSAQVYSVTVADSNGCLDSAINISITEPALDLSISIDEVVNVACKDESTGKIVITEFNAGESTPRFKYTMSVCDFKEVRRNGMDIEILANGTSIIGKGFNSNQESVWAGIRINHFVQAESNIVKRLHAAFKSLSESSAINCK